MSKETVIGVCRYCGQTFSTQEATQEEANALATQRCICDGAKRERRIREIIDDAQDRAAILFGAGGTVDGFVEVDSPQIGELINSAIERVAYGELKEVSMQILGCGSAKITRTKTGGVKITRSRKMSKTEETV